jgi:DNA-binding NarL/FixJ family response regulator
MAHRVTEEQPLVIRARDDHITIISDHLPEGTQEEAADDFWEVQDILARIEPQLIVLDLALPITVGANLLKLIYETHPSVPVITKIESMICEPRFFAIEPTDRGITLKPLTQAPPTAALRSVAAARMWDTSQRRATK